MSWVAVAVAGASLVGASMQSDAAEDAANIQAGSTDRGIAEQRRQFDLSRSDLAPWRAAGATAIENLGRDVNDPNSGLMRKFTMSDFEADPVTKNAFAFGLSEGEKAVQRMFGARGMSRSGAAVKALTRFATDYTGQQTGASRERFIQDQTNAYNRQAGVAGTGQTATNTTAALGANTANNVSGMLTAEGNARGAASIAQGNAYSGALSNIGNNVMGMYTLDRILRPSTNNTPLVMEQVPGQYSTINPAYG